MIRIGSSCVAAVVLLVTLAARDASRPLGAAEERSIRGGTCWVASTPACNVAGAQQPCGVEKKCGFQQGVLKCLSPVVGTTRKVSNGNYSDVTYGTPGSTGITEIGKKACSTTWTCGPTCSTNSAGDNVCDESNPVDGDQTRQWVTTSGSCTGS